MEELATDRLLRGCASLEEAAQGQDPISGEGRQAWRGRTLQPTPHAWATPGREECGGEILGEMRRGESEKQISRSSGPHAGCHRPAPALTKLHFLPSFNPHTTQEYEDP